MPWLARVVKACQCSRAVVGIADGLECQLATPRAGRFHAGDILFPRESNKFNNPKNQSAFIRVVRVASKFLMSSPTTKNVNVKQSNAAQDARTTRLKNTVELRKTRTEDRVKRLRNIEEDEESVPSVSYANGPSVSAVPGRTPCLFVSRCIFVSSPKYFILKWC